MELVIKPLHTMLIHSPLFMIALLYCAARADEPVRRLPNVGVTLRASTQKEKTSVIQSSQKLTEKVVRLGIEFLDETSTGSAGILFDGITSKSGSTLRLRLEPATHLLTLGGEEAVWHEVVEDRYLPITLELAFAAESLQVRRAGVLILEVPIRFERAECNVSFFASDTAAMLTRWSATADERTLPRRDWNLDLSHAEFKKLRSPWQDYFGMHYMEADAIAPPAYTALRDPGGAKTGFSTEAKTTPRIGPFSGKEINVSLDSFRFYARKGQPRADRSWAEIIARRTPAILLMPETGMSSVCDRDRVYWFLRDVYSVYPNAAPLFHWEWGNEIDGLHLGTDLAGAAGHAERMRTAGVKSTWALVNLPEDAVHYAENYMAPGIEAMRKASQDSFGDDGRIPVMTGSFANIYSQKHRQWMYAVLDRVIDGEQAPTLAGQTLSQCVNIINVHYPFSAPAKGGPRVLQEIWDRYRENRNIKGLWITEEHGSHGEGPVTIVDRGMQFIDWVTANDLTAEQTKLFWWGTEMKRIGGTAGEAVMRLGHFLAGPPVRVCKVEQSDATIHAFLTSDDKIMLVIEPSEGNIVPPGRLTLQLPVPVPEKLQAVSIQYSAIRPPIESQLISTITTPSQIQLELPAATSEPLLLFINAL